ncbi:UDP-glucose--hexose-1-phosphate uridylyltransferase [Halobacillus amylolyticus]|uniref:Galactose-1-phosphate uridylyltransferase n=1 Tax=Halobacillus amylolyticus TaxID=2932259 RepID=A0ABY4HAG4_9BACI|nr:UDP-glucose--hexose-1-phosphate uridylyltransferase [Halobacillus amylolyticus]UOR11599.1 UDP-glucose--hexose-1-phosphate uridylyltransferase [Halobacillus amylolyticus]
MNIFQSMNKMINYGLNQNLIEVWDIDYVRNQWLDLFQLAEFDPDESFVMDVTITDPVPILNDMLDYAVEKGVIPENTITDRDLFDPQIMDQMIAKPSEIIRHFYKLYEEGSPKAATNYYYHLSQASYYIRTDRIAKNLHWYSHTEYGDLEITINLSKPEKDPKVIAASKKNAAITYPKCLLCKENEGYAGRLDHPARQNHRVIPIMLEGERWYLQYSPYVYYNEHSIVFSSDHRPMKVSHDGFSRLLDFVDQFPHYFIGSNADLPIVGGSILSHDHFQAGHHIFPMAKAEFDEIFEVAGFSRTKFGIVNWPMSVIRLQGTDKSEIASFAAYILKKWKAYSDPAVEVLAATNDESHQTITPIARSRDGLFELDLVLRNNRTSEEHPMGIFHPHEHVHHIKKENIGLIEVMGLAVLPGRLIEEMDQLLEYMVNNDLHVASEDEKTAKHLDWAKGIIAKYPSVTKEDGRKILDHEIGIRFAEVLEHAGVFKRTEQGRAAFIKFIRTL